MSLATPALIPEVSILAPAKDEAENLPEFVRQSQAALLPLPYVCELIVVNDGSPGPRCTSTATSGASIPASARLATVASDIGPLPA